MRRNIVKLSLVIVLFMTMPIPAVADEIFPILSMDIIVGPNVWGNLVNDMNQSTSVNYTAICRSNASSAYIKLDFYDVNDTLTDTTYFSFGNFTIFSFRLSGNATKFDAVAENLGGVSILVCFDLYNQSLENLSGMTFVVAPIFPTEFILITNNVTIIQKEIVREVIIDISDFQAIMIGVGGFCIALVYFAAKEKKKRDKPIHKLTLDDLFDEYLNKRKKK